MKEAFVQVWNICHEIWWMLGVGGAGQARGLNTNCQCGGQRGKNVQNTVRVAQMKIIPISMIVVENYFTNFLF